MPTGSEQIYAALAERRSETERIKVARRLPPDSGLEAVGIRMKDVFDTAKTWTDLPLDEVPDLLASRWYEVRMAAVAIMDFKARRRGAGDADRRALYNTYLGHHDRLTAWDLIDRAAPRVVGWYLLDKPRQPLFELAQSDVPLERRTAITAAFWLIRNGDLDDPLALAEMLLADDSELVTRPVGTALREVGQVDQRRLVEFLRRHRTRMRPSTFRLATDRLGDDLRADLADP